MKRRKISPQQNLINLFFVLLAGFVVINGVALAILQQQNPAVGLAVKTPFSAVPAQKGVALPTSPSSPAASRCVDSDGGADAAVPGMTTYYTGAWEGETRFDLCGGSLLVERICVNGKVQTQMIDCTSLELRCLEDAELKGYCG